MLDSNITPSLLPYTNTSIVHNNNLKFVFWLKMLTIIPFSKLQIRNTLARNFGKPTSLKSEEDCLQLIAFAREKASYSCDTHSWLLHAWSWSFLPFSAFFFSISHWMHILLLFPYISFTFQYSHLPCTWHRDHLNTNPNIQTFD